jgi:hypothetical protein
MELLQKLEDFLAVGEQKILFAQKTHNETAFQLWQKIRLNILDRQNEIIGGKKWIK